jgi:hypothetical protein
MTEPFETFVAYTNSFPALERTLRFLQASTSLTAQLSETPATTTRFAHARDQIHLTRRFFRCTKFVDTWAEVLGFGDDGSLTAQFGSAHENLRMLRDSTLGLYFFLDALVLPTALGVVGDEWLEFFIETVTSTDGVKMVPLEKTATVCWFWALVLSVFVAAMEVYMSRGQLSEEELVPSRDDEVVVEVAAKTTPKKGGKKGKGKAGEKDLVDDEKPATGKEVEAYADGKTAFSVKPIGWSIRELICNSLDVLIPGTAAGYFSIDPAYVSIAMGASSFITMLTIWKRIYREKEAANFGRALKNKAE